MKRLLMLTLLAGMVLGACQKSNDDPGTPPPPPPGGGGPNNDQLRKDSTILWGRELYLWRTQIPATFNANNYADPNKIMEALRRYSNEPGFTQPVDRWSFAVLKEEWDDVSSGIAADLGIGIFFKSNDDLRVTYVEKEGAAGKAGVERSWRIIRINGNSNINTSDASINFIVDAVYGGDPATIEFLKPDGNTVELELTPSTYQEQPLLLDSVYQTGGKKIGYMVYNSFLGDQEQTKADFANLFAEFQAKGVKDMVVDLRYNGGGYVALWEELANYLAPRSAEGQVMYRQSFNERYDFLDTTVNFSKKGSVDLDNLIFIVSQNTASASEGLINSLTPHIPVKIVGPSNSHGKPVGYFPLSALDWYVFPVSFRTVNSQNSGNYFNGFAPDSRVPDGLDKAWGDLEEDCLASAIRYLTTGNFQPLSVGENRVTEEFLDSYRRLPSKKLKVMVEDRRSLESRIVP